MGNYIPFDTPGGVIWAEVENPDVGSFIITTFQNEAFASFQDVANALTANAQYLQGVLAELAPASIEISFGIKAGINPGSSATTDTTIFGLAKGTNEANYNVKLKWEAQNNES